MSLQEVALSPDRIKIRLILIVAWICLLKALKGQSQLNQMGANLKAFLLLKDS